MAEKLLRFKDMYTAEYLPGEDEYLNYRAKRRKNGAISEEVSDDVDEALNMQQRLARGRQFKRLKAKIKIGRERAKRKMASKEKLEGRAKKQARTLILKKLTKGVDKSELSFARRQEIEKRMEKPQVKKRINMLARRMFKDVRKKEVERKKG
jgi:hypothetical protein